MDSSRINYNKPFLTEDTNLKIFAFDDDMMHSAYINSQKIKNKIKELNVDLDDYEWYDGIASPEGNEKIIDDLKLEIYKEKLLEVVSQFDKKYYEPILNTLLLHLGSTGLATVHIFQFEKAPTIYTSKGPIQLPSWVIQIHTELSHNAAFIFEGMEEPHDEGYISHKFQYLSRDHAEVTEGLMDQEPWYILDVLSTYLLLTCKPETLAIIDDYNFKNGGLENIQYAKEHFGQILTESNPYKL